MPQILNVKNKWVPDTKKINEAREAERIRVLTSLIKFASASGAPSLPVPPTVAEPPPASSNTGAVDQMALIEARVKQILRKER